MKKYLRDFLPSHAQWKRATPFTRLAYLAGLPTIILFLIYIFSLFIKDSNDKGDNPTYKDESSTTIINNPVKIIEGNENTNNSLSYAISGVNSFELKNKIESRSKIKIENNSTNRISISHTGELKKLSKGYDSYIYNGGNIRISVNQKCFYVFKEFKIPAIRANPKHLILEEIQKIINFSVNNNTGKYSNKIIECIKNQ